jgi:tRNA/rRNA methyltransferase
MTDINNSKINNSKNIATHNPFLSVNFVLVAPRMAANVGSAARAIKTMGFSQLILVRPPNDGFQATFNFKLDHPEAVALASGAQDVLANARIVDTIDEALNGCHQSIAMTARPREWGGQIVQLPQYTVQAAQRLLSLEQGTERIAYVFGNERFGLSNEDVTRCSAVCSINVNPNYSSLNLSQAVQVVAYAQRTALIESQENNAYNTPSTVSRELASETLATHEQIQGMAQHWLNILEAADYYDPLQPRRLKERLASLWARAGLTRADVDMLRGMATALSQPAKK